MSELIDCSTLQTDAGVTLLCGETNSGKTTQARTLPKPCLVITHEAKTRNALQGAPGIKLAEFIVQKYELGLQTKSKTEKVLAAFECWESFKSFMYKMRSGDLWKEYKSVVYDGLTSGQQIHMTHRLEEQGHVGQGPQTGKRDDNDYDAPIRAMLALCGEFTAISARLNIPFVVIGHRNVLRDLQGNPTEYTLDTYGRSARFIPRMVTNSLFLFNRSSANTPKFSALTRTGMTDGAVRVQYANTAIKRADGSALPFEIDLTIGDWAKPEEYGLGALLKGQWKESK